MAYGIRLHVWGERACFTRPEMKVERFTYEVPTPSAARGILEAIHWKPQIAWVIDRLHVLRPICTQTFRRNEVGSRASAALATRAMKSGNLEGIGLVADQDRQQRAATILTEVAYVIEAHFVLTAKGRDEDPAKHAAMFKRRAAAGQCFHRPCLGTREFPADFAILADGEALPASTLPERDRNRDLGWMLHDIDFADGRTSRFFRARLKGGVLDVAACLAESGLTA